MDSDEGPCSTLASRDPTDREGHGPERPFPKTLGQHNKQPRPMVLVDDATMATTFAAPTCTCFPAARHGEPFNEFIAENFGECLYSRREIASFIVGMSSMAFWVACQLPQFKVNYEKKSANALSKWFLLEWFMGDALNLVGAFMTHQLVTQLATATLFIVNDALMISQITYYTYYGAGSGRLAGDADSDDVYEEVRRQAADDRYEPLLEGDEEDDDDEEAGEGDDDVIAEQDGGRRSGGVAGTGARVGVSGVTGAALAVVFMLGVAVPVTATASVVMAASAAGLRGDADGRTADNDDGHVLSALPDCEAHTPTSAASEALGITIGWVSAVVYLSSRLPQILKNHQRKSVEGLSVVMFFCAVMGNTTYGLGVLLRDSSWPAIHKALPWLTGSLGTLLLDFSILLQFWYFDEGASARAAADRRRRAADAFDGAFDGDGASDDCATAALPEPRRSPQRGLFGLNSWETSPYFKPLRRTEHAVPRPPPMSLRDTTSLGVLPSESSLARSLAADTLPRRRHVASEDFTHAALLMERSESFD